MRLYLSGISKLGIGYTPDTIIVNIDNKRYEYDIRGTTDYNPRTLSTRTKGDLAKRNDRKDDYFVMKRRGYKHLLKLLKNPRADVLISIYPVDESQYDDAPHDSLTDTVGTLWFRNESVSFYFHTEFYGI